MQKYHFSGHLNPTPPGYKPFQLSGDVYLAADVDATVALYIKQIKEQQSQVNLLSASRHSYATSNRRLEREIRALKRKPRAKRKAKRS